MPVVERGTGAHRLRWTALAAASFAFLLWLALLARYTYVDIVKCDGATTFEVAFGNFLCVDAVWLFVLYALIGTLTPLRMAMPRWLDVLVIDVAVVFVAIALRASWSAITGDLTCIGQDDAGDFYESVFGISLLLVWPLAVIVAIGGFIETYRQLSD